MLFRDLSTYATIVVLVLSTCSIRRFTLALSLPSPPSIKTTESSSSIQTSRRDVAFGSLLTICSSILAINPTHDVVNAEEETPKPEISSLIGTYTDPINHPGGIRKIELTGTGFGGYQLARVVGGGGRGEPASYELPAMIFECPGNRQALQRANSGKLCITIDFSPKGGPRDFTGYYDDAENGIRFILDNNFWPKQ